MGRALYAILILAALGGAAHAAGGPLACADACASACGECAQRCGESRDCHKSRPCKPCGVFEPVRCITLPGAPCLCLKHKCATPLYPCGGYCIPEACHKPEVTCYPSGEVCLPKACHKPVTPVSVEFCCECQPSLTGSRELIASSCGCSKCAGEVKHAECAECAGCTADGWAD